MSESESILRHWQRLAAEAHFHAGELATLAGLSPRQLRRRIRRIFGVSPCEWLAQQRFGYVKSAVSARERVKEIAKVSGLHPCSFRRWVNQYELRAAHGYEYAGEGI